MEEKLAKCLQSLESRPPTVSEEPTQQTTTLGVQEKFAVPSSKVGIVVGKHGHNLGYIAAESGAEVVLESEPDPADASKRLLRVGGSAAQVERAKTLVTAFLKSVDYHQTGNPDNSVALFLEETEEIQLPNCLVGTLLGKQGETLARLHSESGSSIAILKDCAVPKGAVSRSCLIGGSNRTATKNQLLRLVNSVGGSFCNTVQKPRVCKFFAETDSLKSFLHFRTVFELERELGGEVVWVGSYARINYLQLGDDRVAKRIATRIAETKRKVLCLRGTAFEIKTIRKRLEKHCGPLERIRFC